MEWKIWVHATQNADEVGFEGLYGFFCQIAAVVVGWDELVCHVVVSNGVLELRRALVVEDVVFWGDSRAFESVNDGLICAYHFAGCAILHCFLEDSVAVWVCKDHDILVATT